MKVLTVVGARPQFIKAAAVSRALRSSGEIREVLVHTGQHYDQNMSEVFFDELRIPRPDVNLGAGSGSHGQQTGKMLAALEQVLLEEQPDWVLVYGDTNSTLAGALAAVKLHVPIAHVEAGVRSFNRHMPEEINRVLTDHAADLLLAPTTIAVDNLRREGISAEKIHMVGDVMYDVALHYADIAEQKSTILQDFGVEPKSFLLATIHRAENTDEGQRLKAIFSALSQLAARHPVVLPLHPRTRAALDRAGLLQQAEQQLKLVPPVGYIDMTHLERNALVVVTDSGGVQKEAFFHHVPCVTVRSETEWMELVDAHCNALADPSDEGAIIGAVEQALNNGFPTAAAQRLYGEGTAAEKVVESIVGSADLAAV